MEKKVKVVPFVLSFMGSGLISGMIVTPIRYLLKGHPIMKTSTDFVAVFGIGMPLAAYSYMSFEAISKGIKEMFVDVKSEEKES